MSEIIVKRRKPSILVAPTVSGIVNLLECATHPRRFSQLNQECDIVFKKSFIFYLKYCVDKSLIINDIKYSTKRSKLGKSWFVTSERGRIFLELVK